MRKLLSLIICACMLVTMLPAQNVKAEEIDPKLIVESYSLESTNVVYGEATVLRVTLHNMSTTHAENEVILSYTANGDVIPAMGMSNQTYIDTILPGETVEVGLPVVIVSSEEGIVSMAFTLRYSVDDEELKQVYTNTSYIAFSITTGGKLEVNKITVADSVTAGGKAIVGVGYTNSAKGTIGSAKMVIEYEGKTETFNMGSVEGEKSGYYESYISFANEGIQEVKVTVEYTDITGRDVVITEETHYVNVFAKTSGTTNPSGITPNTNSDTTSTVLILVGAVLLVCALFGVLYSRKKK